MGDHAVSQQSAELSPSPNGWTETTLHSSFGNIFELSPGNNGWTYSDLHDFDGSDGSCPFGVLALDSSGNLYGTTFQGAEGGVAFEITP